MNAVKGMTLNSTSIGEAALAIPPKPLQDAFANFVESCDKLKFEAQKFIKMLIKNKNKIKRQIIENPFSSSYIY